jgi:hypothetical protein
VESPRTASASILDPTDPDVAVIDAAIREVAATQWKDKAANVLEMLTEKGRVAFLKKDYRNTKGEVQQGLRRQAQPRRQRTSEDKQAGLLRQHSG